MKQCSVFLVLAFADWDILISALLTNQDDSDTIARNSSVNGHPSHSQCMVPLSLTQTTWRAPWAWRLLRPHLTPKQSTGSNSSTVSNDEKRLSCGNIESYGNPGGYENPEKRWLCYAVRRVAGSSVFSRLPHQNV